MLAHELYGNGSEGVILMHDFFGCKDTWTFAKNFLTLSISLMRSVKFAATANRDIYSENIHLKKPPVMLSS